MDLTYGILYILKYTFGFREIKIEADMDILWNISGLKKKLYELSIIIKKISYSIYNKIITN